MFASRKSTLDVAVATLAGLAAAGLAFAAPAGLLADMVGATGLASILPAAEPPLGMEARLGLGAGVAVLVFAAALLLLRRLGRFSARRAEEAEEAAAVLEAPRRRRRDIHPDAPARPPLLAGHEVGEPEPGPQGWAADAPDPFQESLRESRSQAEAVAPSQRTRSEELPVGFARPEAPFEAAWEEPAETLQPWPLASAAPEPEPEPAAVEAAPGHAPGSIPDLIARLEWGLARCRLAPPPQPAPGPVQVAAPEPMEPPAGADDRLQSAILNLQRLAARRH